MFMLGGVMFGYCVIGSLGNVSMLVRMMVSVII